MVEHRKAKERFLSDLKGFHSLATGPATVY
jgi:hypothetical protein